MKQYGDCTAVRLSSQGHLGNNAEPGLSFKNKTCEVGVFYICTLLYGSCRVMERAVREANSADEGFRDIQMPEAEQKSVMNLSCQHVVTGSSQTPQAFWNQAGWCSRLGGGCSATASVMLQFRSPDFFWSE